MQKINYLDFKKDYKKRKSLYLKVFDQVMEKGIYILGDEVKKFEEEFAKYVDKKYCIGVANGLEALQISLMALGIGVGDEVITTPLSAVATTLSIIAVGATPVFVDIKNNGQLDEKLIEKAITKKTKAILPVHLYGQPLEIEKIKNICKRNKLFLIEDTCQAHGTKHNGRMVGSFGDIACYSFYPTKNLGAIGDGGAITTNNQRLAKIMYQLRDYGQESKYVHSRYGLNSRLDELQAAILRVKLKYLNEDNKLRLKIAERYLKNLSGIKGLEMITPNVLSDSNFHLFVVKTDFRDKLQNYLKENGVPSLVHYPVTIPDQPLFNSRYTKSSLPVTRKFVKNILSLPCHPYLRLSEVDYVSNIIKQFFK